MQKRKQSRLGKKAGSSISDPIEPPARTKGKKPKKQSKGKQKH